MILSIKRTVMALGLATGVACGTPDQIAPTAPGQGGARPHVLAADVNAGAQVALCHKPEAPATLIEVAAAALQVHLAHGDYVARLEVDPDGPSGDGVHFRRIGDALAAARATRVAYDERRVGACRITIAVASGTYRGLFGSSSDPAIEAFPLVIDVPDITLHGALDLVVDEQGRATDHGSSDAGSIMTPVVPLTTIASFSQPILAVNGRSDGFAGNGTVIEGFAFQSGNTLPNAIAGGLAVLSKRVERLVVRGNRFEAGFSESVDLRSSSGAVERNHLSGGGGTCDICLAGPGSYVAEGNRLLAGGIPGILVVPAVLLPVPAEIEQDVLPPSSTVNALLVNNEVRDHQRLPVGTGLRVGAIGIGAPNVAGFARVVARNNLLVNNRFGMLVEAAFPLPGTLRSGNIDLELEGNTFASSCQNHMLVSFSRHTTALGLTNNPYLLNSRYTISLGGDLDWDEVWYGHPEGFGNVLTVDGVQIANGIHHAYDPTKVCP